MSVVTTIPVLDAELPAERVIQLVRGRSATARVRSLLGTAPQVAVLGELYWPIAVIRASAAGTFWGKPWTDRVLGAIDLVTGRIGLVDVSLPATRETTATDDARIEARLSQQEALAVWHEYFRDYVDRRRKPLRPPALTVDGFERLWLPNHLVSADGHSYLVDPLVGRVDRLRDFPGVARQLRASGATT